PLARGRYDAQHAAQAPERTRRPHAQDRPAQVDAPIPLRERRVRGGQAAQDGLRLMASTLDRATERLADAATLLDGVGEDLDGAAQLLGLLGWDVPSGVADLQLAGADVTTVLQRLAELNVLRGEQSPDDL